MTSKTWLGLALSARLHGNDLAGQAAWARVQAASGIHCDGADADVLTCDSLTIHGLQAAELLRGLPWWTAAHDTLIDAWIKRELAPAAGRMQQMPWAGSRWRGTAASLMIAAWRGDDATVRSLMATVRADIPALLSNERLVELVALPDDDHSLHQMLVHALLCADIARVAGGDATPPPAEWTSAVAGYVARQARSIQPDFESTHFLRMLGGPGPWRSVDAARAVSGPEPMPFAYGWYFPALMTQDPEPR